MVEEVADSLWMGRSQRGTNFKEKALEVEEVVMEDSLAVCSLK